MDREVKFGVNYVVVFYQKARITLCCYEKT